MQRTRRCCAVRERQGIAVARGLGVAWGTSGAQVKPHVRFEKLLRLAERVRRGERLALRCHCAPKRCHGHVIAAWIRERSAE